MYLKIFFVGAALVSSSVALAEDALPEPMAVAPSASIGIIADDADRAFPLNESAAVPGTFVRARTIGQAATGQIYSIGQSVEIVPVQRVSLRVTAELAPRTGLTPSVQAKYQFLVQERSGVNVSGGIRYKQVGLANDGGEAEVFVAAGRSFGHFLATANAVVGLSVRDPNEGDLTGQLSIGYEPTERLLVGVGSRLEHGLSAPGGLAPGERPFELIAGPVVGYSFGVVDLSLQYGLYLPQGADAPSAGQIGVLGANVSF